MNFQKTLIQTQNVVMDAFLEKMQLELQEDGFKVIKVSFRGSNKVKSLNNAVVECSVGKKTITLKGRREGIEWRVVVDGFLMFNINDTSQLKTKLIARREITEKDLQENIDNFTSLKITNK